jgi:hypothetical protein
MEIMRRHRSVFLLPLVALLVALPASAQAAQRVAPPSKALVVKQLSQRYAKFAHYDLPNVTRFKVTLGSVRSGAPHIGDAYYDGTPSNTQTMVFPVATSGATYISCNAGYAYRAEYSAGKFGFFRDEFGTWTFKGTENRAKFVKLASCPL